MIVLDKAPTAKNMQKGDTRLTTIHGFVRCHVEASIDDVTILSKASSGHGFSSKI